MKRILATIALLLLVPAQAWAQSTVWKVQQGDAVLYLGGTCHLLRPADFPPPPEFATAYRAAAMVVFETDIGAFNDPATHQKFMAKARYADGSFLQQHLSPQTYSLLSGYCAANGIPLAALAPLRPAIVAVTLAAMELAKLGVTSEGVDAYFYQLAVSDKKKLAGLESVDEQINFIVGIGEGREDDFVTYSLKDLDSIRQLYGEMIEAWRTGASEKLDQLLADDLKGEFPEIYRKLITERNASWLPQIEAFLKTPETEFVLVGAGHLVGADGIIATLRRNGYKVEKL